MTYEGNAYKLLGQLGRPVVRSNGFYGLKPFHMDVVIAHGPSWELVLSMLDRRLRWQVLQIQLEQKYDVNS